MKYSVACGIEHNAHVPLPLSGEFTSSMKKAHEYGFDAVEIHTPCIEELDLSRIKKASKDNSILVSTLGTGSLYSRYGLYLMDQDEEKRGVLKSKLKHYIEVASDLGSMVTIGSIKGNVKPDEDRVRLLKTFGEELSSISEFALREGVTILLEATNRYENNVLNKASEVVDFIEKYGIKNAKILMDSFHINIEEEDLGGCLSEAGKHLGYIHLSDNTRLYPGSGSFRWDTFIKEIEEVGYDGFLSIECLPQPSEEKALRKSMEFLRKNFSSCG